MKSASHRNGTVLTLPSVGAAGPSPRLAEFAALPQELADAPSWPLHLSVWLKPDRAPNPPQWSGLAIERRYRIPAPGFLPAEVHPVDLCAVPDFSCEARASAGLPRIPECDAAPLGWDPRGLCPKEKEK